MSLKTYREAINEALLQEMQKDENVVIIGEDVAGGAGTNGEQDAWGGVLGVTKGLLKHFGRERIIDTPITETAIMGMASGAALTGLRPVAELMFVDFMGVCFDQILNQTAKFRYMFGGKAVTPLTIRTMYGGGLRAVQDVPPFILAADHPLTYKGVNLVGLKRRGFSKEERKSIKQIYNLYFKSGLNRKDAMEKIKAEISTSTVRDQVVEFIQASDRGII